MVPVFILSNRNYTGKTFFALGLALKLMSMGYKVGYMKPLGQTPFKIGRELFDEDSIFIKEQLSLPEELQKISPFVLSFEAQSLIYNGSLKGVKEKIMSAFDSFKDKDFLIIGGAGDFFDGATLEIDAIGLIRQMKARALFVEAWRGDISADSLFGARQLLGSSFAGGVLNKVPANAYGHVLENVKPFLESNGVNVLGVFKKDSILESFTVRQLNEILNGTVLCCEDRLDEAVENFSVGAMDVDSALNYFRKIHNKAVITGAHRSDIQLAAMETSTRCIILTGGLHTNEIVLGKAQSKGIPIISVADDTFTTIDKIEGVMGKTKIREKEKIKRTKELIEEQFDMQKFLSCVKNV